MERRERIADVVLVAFASWLVWRLLDGHSYGWAERCVVTSVGAGLGLAARIGDARGARWPRLVTGLVAVALAGVTVRQLVHDLAYETTITRTLAVAASDLALPGLAAFALGGDARRLPFALGLGAASVLRQWLVPLAVPGVAVFLVARYALVATGEPARQRISSLGAGACAGLAATAFAFDLVARTVRLDPWVYVDGLATAAPRMALELVVASGALQLALGRTRGLLALGLGAAGLALALRCADLPNWGGHCAHAFHPLVAAAHLPLRTPNLVRHVLLDPTLMLALPLAVLPWVGPVARAALRCVRTPSSA